MANNTNTQYITYIVVLTLITVPRSAAKRHANPQNGLLLNLV